MSRRSYGDNIASMACDARNLISTQAAGGPFENGDWESPYPLPYHCDDPCVILEPRLRPAARAAMLDCVLNLLVQPLITVAGSDRSAPRDGGVDDGGVSEAVWKSNFGRPRYRRDVDFHTGPRRG